MIEIHTDGACSGNPGHGGWAAAIRSPEGVREIFGAAPDTTNNRMELQAAIEGLRAVPATSPVNLYSDSEYLIRGMTEWMAGWKRRNWRTAANKPVENRDLWETLDALAGARVTWHWVRGHAGHPDNERANILAQRAARGAGFGSEISGDGGATSVTFPCYLSLVNGVAARHATWDACEARTNGRSRADKRKCRSLKEAEDILRDWGHPPDLPEEWQGSATNQGPSPSAPRQPGSRLFARGLLGRVRSCLEAIGFRHQPHNGQHVAFHLVRRSAHAVAYMTGRLQAQGTWTEPDWRDWANLSAEEDGWLRTTVDAGNGSLAAPAFWTSPRMVDTQLRV